MIIQSLKLTLILSEEQASRLDAMVAKVNSEEAKDESHAPFTLWTRESLMSTWTAQQGAIEAIEKPWGSK